MEIVNRALYEEINLKVNKIKRNPQLFENRKKEVIKNLRDLGDIYSWWRENPGLRKSLLLGNKNPKTIQKEAIKGIHHIKNAWYYLTQKGRETDFVEVLDESILKKTNYLVEPEFDGTGDFRKRDVTLDIEGYTPSSWEKVPEKISKMILQIKEHYRENPLESALMAHFEITRIQPFMEGNKRTGRLIQDRILLDLGMPPVVINSGEGKFYFDLLKRILPHYDRHNSETFKQFYDYCASKINNGLDSILNDLDNISAR